MKLLCSIQAFAASVQSSSEHNDCGKIEPQDEGSQPASSPLPPGRLLPLQVVHISDYPTTSLSAEEASMLAGLSTPAHFLSSSAPVLPLQMAQCHSGKWWQKKTQDSKDWILGPKRISNQQLKESPFPYSDKEEQESLQMKKDAPRALCQDFNNIKTGMWEEERKRRWRARGPAVSTGCVDRRSPGAAERSRQS